MQMTAPASASPGARLLQVARVLRDRPALRVALALVIPVAMNLGLRTVSSPWLLWIWPAVLLLGMVLAFRRGHSFAWISAYLLLLEAWSLLWIAAGHSPMPLQVTYAVDADRLLGLGRLPGVWLQDLLYAGSARPFDLAMAAVYASFFLANQATLFALAFVRRGLLARYVIAFAAASYLSLLVQFLVPTAPPWMAADLGDVTGLVRVSQETFRSIAGSAVDGAYAANINEVAAMPSVHLAATMVIAIAWLRANPRLRWAAVGYPVVMAFALVYFGEHYLVDTIAGAAFALLGWRIADAACARIPTLARAEARHAEPAPTDHEVERPVAA